MSTGRWPEQLQRVADMYERIDALNPGKWSLFHRTVMNGAGAFAIPGAAWQLECAWRDGSAAEFDAALEDLESAWMRAVKAALGRAR